jgi:hypothetical protein
MQPCKGWVEGLGFESPPQKEQNATMIISFQNPPGWHNGWYYVTSEGPASKDPVRRYVCMHVCVYGSVWEPVRCAWERRFLHVMCTRASCHSCCICFVVCIICAYVFCRWCAWKLSFMLVRTSVREHTWCESILGLHAYELLRSILCYSARLLHASHTQALFLRVLMWHILCVQTDCIRVTARAYGVCTWCACKQT